MYPTKGNNVQYIFFISLQIYSTCFTCHLDPSTGNCSHTPLVQGLQIVKMSFRPYPQNFINHLPPSLLSVILVPYSMICTNGLRLVSYTPDLIMGVNGTRNMRVNLQWNKEYIMCTVTSHWILPGCTVPMKGSIFHRLVRLLVKALSWSS
jgi:hypothetical protein